jgi:hypothetical protein
MTEFDEAKKSLGKFNSLNMILLVFLPISLFLFNLTKNNFWLILVITDVVLMAVFVIYCCFFIAKIGYLALFRAGNIPTFAAGYLILIIGLILLLSVGFLVIESYNLGYLTYDSNKITFEPSLLYSDQQRSTEFIYFTALSFFSLGFGNIYPVGLSKWYSIFTIFIGHIFNLVVFAFAFYFYIKRKDEKSAKQISNEKHE